jgi:hypothetical protein
MAMFPRERAAMEALAESLAQASTQHSMAGLQLVAQIASSIPLNALYLK